MCALSSVAQLSISVTMSVPSQVDADAETTSSTGGAGKDDQTSVKHRFSLPYPAEEEDPDPDHKPSSDPAAAAGRRYTVPGPLNRRPLALLAETAERGTGVSFPVDDGGGPDGDPRTMVVGSPVNCSGVRIVIESADAEETPSRDNCSDDVGSYVTGASKSEQSVILVEDDDDDNDVNSNKCV